MGHHNKISIIVHAKSEPVAKDYDQNVKETNHAEMTLFEIGSYFVNEGLNDSAEDSTI